MALKYLPVPGEVNGGYDPGKLADDMIAAWKEYQAAGPQMAFVLGIVRSFLGTWKERDRWGWKAGKRFQL